MHKEAYNMPSIVIIIIIELKKYFNVIRRIICLFMYASV